MTSLDPTHLTFGRQKDSRAQAVYRTSDTHTQHGKLRLPPIPDLRFEQAYLKSLAPYIHSQKAGESSSVPQTQLASVEKGKSTREQEVEKVDLVSRVDVPAEYSIEWDRVAYITLRDQVISPLLQGFAFGVIGYYIRPLARSVFWQFQSWSGRIWKPTKVKQEGGDLTNWLRSWARGFMGGVETNLALAK